MVVTGVEPDDSELIRLVVKWGRMWNRVFIDKHNEFPILVLWTTEPFGLWSWILDIARSDAAGVGEPYLS